MPGTVITTYNFLSTRNGWGDVLHSDCDLLGEPALAFIRPMTSQVHPPARHDREPGTRRRPVTAIVGWLHHCSIPGPRQADRGLASRQKTISPAVDSTAQLSMRKSVSDPLASLDPCRRPIASWPPEKLIRHAAGSTSDGSHVAPEQTAPTRFSPT